MRVRTHEEMFLDVDRDGQFIPGVAPPKENGKTFRQIFETRITKDLGNLTNISYHSLGQSFLRTTRDLIRGRDSQMERHFYDELCNIAWRSATSASYDLSAKTLPDDVRVYYIGEFPQPYYENAAHEKIDEMGQRYSTAMDVFYMLALYMSEKNVWDTFLLGHVKGQIAEKRERLKEDKPGFFASKKKRKYYEWQTERTEQEIQNLKKKYISHGSDIDSDLFEIRLIRLWVLHAGHADKKEDRKIRKQLLEWLDFHEKRLLKAVDAITAVERELGIENNSFRPVKSGKAAQADWEDDEDDEEDA